MKGPAVRREGFAGQHLVVLPEPLRQAARVHPLLKGLHVTDAGYFPRAGGHGVERPDGAPTTLVILCLQGSGRVTVGAEDRAVGPGDWLWLPAQVAHAYGSSPEDPWTIAWAHFGGAEVPAWQTLLGGQRPNRLLALALPRDRLGEIALPVVHAAMERGHALRHQISAAAALRHSLSAAAELAVAPGEVRSAEERVLALIESLRQDWVRPRRLPELAAEAGLSVTHFSALFRRQAGFAPIDFLIRRRIRQACTFLDTTSLPIAAIAERVGYDDAYYFTRCFRRVMGCSPRAYRAVPKG